MKSVPHTATVDHSQVSVDAEIESFVERNQSTAQTEIPRIIRDEATPQLQVHFERIMRRHRRRVVNAYRRRHRDEVEASMRTLRDFDLPFRRNDWGLMFPSGLDNVHLSSVQEVYIDATRKDFSGI